MEKVAVMLFLCGFLTVGTYYALENPLFVKPDEAYHYAYTLHLVSGEGLPVIDATKVGVNAHTPVEKEGHQPPLYYATVAGIVSLLGLRDEGVTPVVNPHFLGTPIGNRNPITPSYIALPDMPIFFTGRLVSLTCGAMALIAIYFLSRLFLDWPVAMLVMAMVGLNPQFVFIATSFSNDIMAVAICHIGLWQLGYIIQHGLSPRQSIIFGATIALAVLAKLSGLGLLVPWGFLALGHSRKIRDFRPLFWAGIAGLIVFIVDGWWFWRNWTLYGDPFATNLLPVLLGPRTTPFTWRDLWSLLTFLWKAYWLDFSPGGILFAEPPIYAVLGLLCITGVIGLILALARQKHLRPFFFLLWGWFLIVFAGLLRLTSQTAIFMGGGRLLFPAAITVGATLAVGLTEIFRRPIIPGILAALLGIYAVIAPAHYLSPVYPRPTLTKHLETIPTNRLGAIFGDGQFELIGYDLEQTELPECPALAITFYWRTLRETDQNFSVFIHLETLQQGHPVILTQLDTYPGYGTYPTSVWRKDQIFIDRLTLPLPPPDSPFSGDIVAGLYFLPTMERLPAWDGTGQRYPNDAVLLAQIWRDDSGTLHLSIPAAFPGGTR
ncbi:MAG: glycosyltransferase family 39 protein [Thermoflexales bacterium]|nr:glycosyltransferase family 39 protein [Thermoflexales bacterium]